MASEEPHALYAQFNQLHQRNRVDDPFLCPAAPRPLMHLVSPHRTDNVDQQNIDRYRWLTLLAPRVLAGDYYYRKQKCSSGPFTAKKKRRKVAIEETRFHASLLCDLSLGASNRDNCGYYGWIVLKSDIQRKIFITWTRKVTRLVWLGGISISLRPSSV